MQWSDSPLRPPYFTPFFDPHQGGLGISQVAHVKSTLSIWLLHLCRTWTTSRKHLKHCIGGRRQKHRMLTSIQPLCGPRAARGLLYGTDLYVGANIWSRRPFSLFPPVTNFIKIVHAKLRPHYQYRYFDVLQISKYFLHLNCQEFCLGSSSSQLLSMSASVIPRVLKEIALSGFSHNITNVTIYDYRDHGWPERPNLRQFLAWLFFWLACFPSWNFLLLRESRYPF